MTSLVRIVRVDAWALALRRIVLVVGWRLAGIALGRRGRISSVFALLAAMYTVA